MKEKSKIYLFEPIVFLLFGLFHIHRIWGFIDRTEYANFWLGIMNNRGFLYFLLMSILSVLCLAGIIVFILNIGRNYWWRWVYIFGGGYVLFDLCAIMIKLKIWSKLLLFMFDTESEYWNFVWGFFVSLGVLSFLLGLYIINTMKKSKNIYNKDYDVKKI